mmetsp:Transcript_30192/g.51581  ORF Transcript_30192/g.51581 Transcript_30192/m.51581 type:complete len:140 (-) Transcript_30192:197-616(-)
MTHQASLRTAGLIVAEAGGAVAGFLFFSRSAEACTITKLAVAPSCRRQGVGGELIERGVAEILECRRSPRSRTEIMLHVDPTRRSACRLYERHGFVQHELLRNYYDGARDAVVMRLAPSRGATSPAVTSEAATGLLQCQ